MGAIGFNLLCWPVEAVENQVTPKQKVLFLPLQGSALLPSQPVSHPLLPTAQESGSGRLGSEGQWEAGSNTVNGCLFMYQFQEEVRPVI